MAKNWCLVLLLVAFCLPVSLVATAQTINDPMRDSLKSVTLRNEKMYRTLNQMEDRGNSYEFTNVVAWKITDDELRTQLIKVYTAQFGDKQLKNFDIRDAYLFSAPVAGDRYLPFHVLFMGVRNTPEDSSNGGGVDMEFGGRRRSKSGASVPVAFKGRDVIKLMSRQPGLLDNINAVQGDVVELPGELIPRGTQIIQSSNERYVFHQMFTGFYSKRQIADAQNRIYGMPTSDEEMAATDTTAPAITPEPGSTSALPDEIIQSRAFRYEKLVDLAIDHIGINLSRMNELGITLGNPEVGLPFWLSGQGRLWLNMRNQIGTESDFKIGVDFPLNMGSSQWLTFQPRKMSGFWGGSIDAYFAGVDFFSAFNMPLAFNFSVIPSGASNASVLYSGVSGDVPTPMYQGPKSVDGSKTFFRTTFIGQIYVPFIVQLDPYNFMQFSAGIGIHNVKLSWIPGSDTEAAKYGYGQGQGGTTQDLLWNGRTNVSSPFTPHVGIQFVNHRSNKWGVNFQYDHLFTFGAWLELVQDRVRIEGSYTSPLVRDAKPYEQPYFFAFTPRFYF